MDGGRSKRALVQGEGVRGKSQELSHLRVFGTDRVSRSPLAIGDHPPARSGALPSVRSPRRRAKKWALYQALGISTLARLPGPRLPAPRLAFRSHRLRATSSVSIGGHGACTASGWPTFSRSSMPNARSCQRRISSQIVTHAPPRPSWPSIRPWVGGGTSRRKWLTRGRLERSQYEPCRSIDASWH